MGTFDQHNQGGGAATPASQALKNGSGDPGMQHLVPRPSPSYCPLTTGPDYSNQATPVISRCASPTFGASGVGQARRTLLDKVQSRMESGDKFFSLEFFPPRTKSGAINLLARLERMGMGGPLFVDITWHPAGNPAGESETSSTMIAHSALSYVGLETMLHMTCLANRADILRKYLDKAKDFGIRNILALRGDAPCDVDTPTATPPAATDADTATSANSEPEDSSTSGSGGDRKFKYASDLVSLIKDEYPGDFTVVVAGYPSGHPDAESYEDDILNLKKKVEAGADFVITQLFFKAATFKKFHDDCRAVGIKCPIIPGVMPIQSYDSLRHIVKLSKLEVPEEIRNVVTPLKGNDDAIRNFGVHQATEMIRELFTSGYAAGAHLYTLNREVASISILKRLGLWKTDPAKPLPFKMNADPKRSAEEVRPIFWNKRSRTYIYRTRHWDEFPNGRWGNSASPAFGDLKDYYLFYLASQTPKSQLLEMWGSELSDERDVWSVFTNYLTGELNAAGHKVTRTLFNDEELDAETSLIADNLAAVNRKGVLTINSQPAVNCAPSSDPRVGWGPQGGFVFQKAYLEFFTAEANVAALLQVIKRYPGVNFQVINHDLTFNCTNVEKLRPNAVTWGVFPGAEIKQPTIVDPVSFRAWSEEAFGLWREQWANLYAPESTSRKVIEGIVENYYLVNLVDNDFPMGNCIWNLLDDMFSRKNLNQKIDSKIDLEAIVKEQGFARISENDFD